MSRSELHNWECAIEKLGGENANALLVIAQDIYNTGYVRGKNYELSVIEDIKAEIESKEREVEFMNDWNDGYNSAIYDVLQLINKHISGKEQ